MFKTQNFCHIASNNRNNVKAGVFIYKTNDNLQTVSASGYFNPRIIDINLHDLIIHEYIDPTDNTKVLRNVLCVTVKTLDNIETVVIKSNWEGDIEQEIADLRTYVDNNFVKLDGSSIMSAPLKFVAGSLRGGIGPTFGGVEFYTLNNDSPTYSLITLGRFSTNGFLPHNDNTYDIGSIARHWKDAYIARVITSVLNNGVNINIPQTGGTMALTSDIAIKSTEAQITSPINNQVLKYNGSKWVNATVQDLDNVITNCPIEIPQDIIVEINGSNGLTLKSGSKLYQPNGSGIFTPITISGDKSRNDFSAFGSGTYLVFYSQSYGGLIAINITNCVSGTSDTSTASTHVWYDTTNNVIKTYESGTYMYTDLSLPICIMTNTYGTGVTSIDQVFNGVGYIGVTIFRTGIDYLIPNEFNSDGTLKNTTVSTTSCATYTVSSPTVNHRYTIAGASNGGIALFYTNIEYNEKENLNYAGGTQTAWADLGFVIFTGSPARITSFNPKQTFHAVDYSDFIDKDSQNAKKAKNNTFSGTNTFTGLTRSESDSPKFEYKNTGMNIATSGGTSLGDTYIADARDTNNEQSGYIYNRMLNGTVSMKMGATSKTTGSSKGAEIAPTVENSGKRYIQATTPTKSDNTMDLTSNTNVVATTEWVKGYAMGVPNWSSPTALTANSTWTATANGYVCGGTEGGSGSAGGWIKINNQSFYGFHVYFEHTGSAVGTVPVAKGDTVTVQSGTYYFIPCKNL